MSIKNSPTRELLGWLIPGLALAAYGLFGTIRAGHPVGIAMLAIGLGLVLYGSLAYVRGEQTPPAARREAAQIEAGRKAAQQVRDGSTTDRFLKG